MAENMTISITKEVKELLKNTPNKSGLIDCLVRDYFKSLVPKDLVTEKLELAKKLEEEAKGIILKVQESEKIELEDKQKKEEKIKSKYASTIESARVIFNVEITDEQAKEFQEGNWNTLNGFLIDKGLLNDNLEI